jgi:hypothetical protein
VKPSGTIGRRHLLRMLDNASPTMNGVVDVTRAVTAINADHLELRYVSAEELRGVYGRRRERSPDAHPTRAAVDTLLAALAGYADTYVGTVTLEVAGQVMSVWLTESADSVLATMAADDHR